MASCLINSSKAGSIPALPTNDKMDEIKMDEIEVELKLLRVDAGNLETSIGEIVEEKRNSRLNKDVPNDVFWVRPLNTQIDELTNKWSNPESDGTGIIVYSWRKR